MAKQTVLTPARGPQTVSQRLTAAQPDSSRSNVQVVTASPAEAAALQQLIALFNSRRFAETENSARGLLARNPRLGPAWKMLGASLQMQGKDALAALQKASELMPSDADSHFKLGGAYLRLGRTANAEVCFRRVTELRPESAEAHNNHGAVLFECGRISDAVECARRATRLRPDYAEAYNNLGTFLKELGQFEEAFASYNEAIRLNPTNYKTFGNLGNLYKETGNFDAALSNYRQAVAIKPDLAEAHSNMLYLYNHSSRYTPEYCLEQARAFGKMLFDKVSLAIPKVAV